jgi:hypothetical protein
LSRATPASTSAMRSSSGRPAQAFCALRAEPATALAPSRLKAGRSA